MTLRGKTVRESVHETTHLVMPGDANPHGTAFGGQVMAWIDLAAAISAVRHAREAVVTAGIDAVNFVSKIQLGHLVILKSSVNFTGRCSMEIGVRVESEDPLTGRREHACTAYLTFVAVDGSGQPREVPPVLPETGEERRRHDEARARREHRLALRKPALP